jgi:hypothetical protein
MAGGRGPPRWSPVRAGVPPRDRLSAASTRRLEGSTREADLLGKAPLDRDRRVLRSSSNRSISGSTGYSCRFAGMPHGRREWLALRRCFGGEDGRALLPSSGGAPSSFPLTLKRNRGVRGRPLTTPREMRVVTRCVRYRLTPGWMARLNQSVRPAASGRDSPMLRQRRSAPKRYAHRALPHAADGGSRVASRLSIPIACP